MEPENLISLRKSQKNKRAGSIMKYMVITNHSYMLYQFRTELLKKLQSMGEVVISMPFKGHHDDFINMGFKCIDTKMDRRGINPIEDLELYQF